MPPTLSTTVVICCYTEARWHDLRAACASLRAQTVAPDEIVVVVDHNEALFDLAEQTFTEALVVRNDGLPGLSDARNRGLRAARTDAVLFLDDDAVADERWIERMTAPLIDSSVVAVGGYATPSWDAPGRPAWFPDEFLWVVGCSHLGLPPDGARIRNPIGCAMVFRRQAITRAGDFASSLGRVGSKPVGCEETELALRLVGSNPGTRVVFAREARVSHRVTRERARVGYFVRRCYWEGVSKAAISRRHRGGSPLRTERRFVGATLVRGFAVGIRDAMAGRSIAPAQRSAAIASGLAAATAGYVVGRAAPGRPADRAAVPVARTASASRGGATA